MISETRQEINQPSALTILLETINNQKDYINFLESRINNIEILLRNWTDWWNIRNIPTLIYDINKRNNNLLIKYSDWREVLIPLWDNNGK